MPMAAASCVTGPCSTSRPYKPYRQMLARIETGLALCASLIIFLSGCTSTGRRSEQFRPAPRESITYERELPGEHIAIEQPRRSYAPLQIPTPCPPEVQAEIDELKTRYPEVFQRGLNRGAPYLPEMQRMFRQEGMPEDLVWLAMVESMFQNNAVSSASAAGMWQFIPRTARLYGLRVNRYVDERRNWRKATRAAIAYLRDLHDQFDGNWALAVSGYNMGGRGMQRIVNEMGGETDFWKLVRTPPACNRLKKETRKYYPRLLAYIIVTRNPEKHGFTRKTGTIPDTEEVPISGMYALADLEQTLGLAPRTLEELNPELIRKTTPLAETWNLRVPAGCKERVLAALKEIRPRVAAEEEYELASTGYYTVKKGDTLSKIAKRFHTAPEAIARLNRFSTHQLLRIGQRLRIPGQRTGSQVTVAKMVEAVQTAQVAKETGAQLKAKPPKPVYHSVAKGETLSILARRYGTSVNQLIVWNGLNPKGTIYIGQRLKVADGIQHTAEKSKSPPGTSFGGTVHAVQSGETASAIAARYGVPLKRLLAANNLKPNSILRIGDRLNIPGKPTAQTAKTDKYPAPRAAASTSGTTVQNIPTTMVTEYVVKKGDTLSEIAAFYGTTVAALCARNNLKKRDILREGQKLIIPSATAQAGPQNTQLAVNTEVAAGRKIHHKVEAGQHPTAIAGLYNVPLRDLFTWNGWSSPPVLKVGDTVTVYLRE